MVKRQFLDFLYNHPRKYKKTYCYKHKSKGYSELFSPNQILEEISEETEIGKDILKELEYNHKTLINMSLGASEEDFLKIFEGLFQNNVVIPQDK